ncbi:MAG: hypothetical protein A2Z34_05755 [Planctomycetes bacterium RBG_16_59_8]|nr:MAG: hypothetical protein A2Z34_05755 [Planctomycetes bacterium RBG_16_59_8]
MEQEKKPGDQFDVRQVLNQSTSKSTLKELAQKGIHTVKVIDESAINALIKEAVDRIIATRTNILTEQERKKIYDATRRELQILLEEHRQIKERSDLAERDKSSLIREVENVQRQLHLTRKMSAEEAKLRFEEGIESQKPLIREMRQRIEILERTAQEGSKQEADGEFAQRVLQELAKMNSAIQSNMEEKFQFIGEKVSKHLDQEQERNVAQQQGADLRRRLEEMGQKDDRIAGRIESLFQRMSDTLARKIQGISLRAMASGDNAYDYRLSDATLDALLKEELDSNLQAIEAEEVEAAKVGESLDKLRALRKSTGKTQQGK